MSVDREHQDELYLDIASGFAHALMWPAITRTAQEKAVDDGFEMADRFWAIAKGRGLVGEVSNG